MADEDIEKKFEERKSKFKDWLKDHYNFTFLVILIFVIIIRFYYFFLTKNQPLWWDEAEYMSAAKSYAGIGDIRLPSNRLPFFSLLMSIFYITGITNEIILRFVTIFIPSIILIALLYICIKEMYPDKRIALISMLIFSVLWEHLFYSNRFHTENFSLIFEFLAIFVLFKSYMKKENFFFIKPKYSLLLVLLFSVISILFRPGNLPFVPILFLFFLLLNQSFFLERKKRIYFIIGLMVLIILSIFFIINLSKIPLLKGYYHPENKIALHSLLIFKGFYESVIKWSPSIFYYAFILGIIISFIYIVILIDKIKNIKRDTEELEFKSDIFNFLMILFVLIFFVFIMRDQGIAYRWFFMFLPAMLSFTSKGIIIFSEFIAGFFSSKKLTLFLIVLITLLGSYNQLVHSDQIIKYKIDSYQQVKDSGLWIKEHSSIEDIIISASQTQHAYYSERKIENFYIGSLDRNETLFNEKIKEIKPKYIVVSIFEPGFTPQWAYDWPQRNNETVMPVQVYFLDKEQKQPALVIYEFNLYRLNSIY